MNECYCICHTSEDIVHCGPCCWQCQYCLRNITDTPEDHYKECWSAKETKMVKCQSCKKTIHFYWEFDSKVNHHRQTKLVFLCADCLRKICSMLGYSEEKIQDMINNG